MQAGAIVVLVGIAVVDVLQSQVVLGKLVVTGATVVVASGGHSAGGIGI